MDTVKKKMRATSLKRAFILYFVACLLVAVFLSAASLGLCQFGQSMLYKKYQAQYNAEIGQQGQVILENSELGGKLQIYTRDIRSFYTGFEEGLDKALDILGIALVPVWFAVCIGATGALFYRRKLQKPLAILDAAADNIAENNLDFTVSYDKGDEMGRLCRSFEKMRAALQENHLEMWRQLEERRRLNAAFSHDLRTPLTKLMGYLEILRRCQSGEEREKYLRLAAEKAEQIKGMTDQLFDRAQVPDSREALAREPELVDGAQLLGQILSEVCGDLQREGFQAPQPVFTEPFRLYLRPEDAVRVFDNLFSNLCKYGDPASPVTFSVERGPGTVTVAAENRVRPDPDRRDSHGVGLPTMSELMERCGGRLETERRGETFRTAAVFAVSGDMK